MTLLALIAIGLVAGVTSASLGVGGGIVMVPAMVVLLSFDQHLAQGTSLAVIVPTTVIGAYVHARAGRVVWRSVIPIAAGGIVGGLVGGRVALAIDASVLRRMFAVLLVITALRMLGKTRRSARTESAHQESAG